jgi:N-formylglutamate amidohydrolase
MNFEKEINELELLDFDSDFIIKKGSIPIIFTAPHTMEQLRDDGTIKLSEPYTKAIALYLNKYFDVNCMVKIKDTNLDANKDNRDDFKTELLRFIKENNIGLVIDLHGSNRNRNFDIEFGTLNNLSASFSTIKELEEAFTENGINNIIHNDPFKGGAITQYVYGIKDVDVIQVEINGKYRDSDNIVDLKLLIKSFENFIKQYKEYINR